VPTRILLLITDLKIGGTPTVVRELALRLHNDPDFEVHVACLDHWGQVADQLQQRGVRVTALGASSRLDVRVVSRLVRLIREERIDTVFSFLIHANAVAAAAARFVGGVRFLQSIQTTQPNPGWHWSLQNMIQGAAEKIVVPSQSVAQAAVQRAGIDARKIQIIANAVELPEEPIRTLDANETHVAFIGRLDPVKRIGDLVTAVSLLFPPVYLDIYGGGSEWRSIQAAIESLDLQSRAFLHGPIENPAGALASTDVLVLPSDAEGFGLVLIEAMAAGVPVVGTNVPGIRDVIANGVNGLLVPVRNPGALADAIARLLSDSALRQKLVAGGIKAVQERFTWQIVYPQYRGLLLKS
jgi:glycosyltransferase involved in cell wall biosynthesis